ncbi:Mg/Co/Ni transporter MgtE [Flavobacterium sp. CG_23.5]|uniref:hypothetical protein n=1 Tax=unclassified Flavobacterium TaxID=196869 RepID=UPI0018C9A6D7|nr:MULTISPECIES: hypothetical protein [unclassified Flavobacterium]MBG6109363.1 Mg/Co/Ni transporter MgtE [Flavobacterium sp. CG_9.10]MBP2283390.1 Mg/Co/Ni transporter MgtE [Flavobacterium sp. CG_23.5]
MDIQSEKLELIKMLLETDDKTIIEAIKNIFKSEKKEVWEKLSPEQQEEINIVIQKENRGDIVDF